MLLTQSSASLVAVGFIRDIRGKLKQENKSIVQICENQTGITMGYSCIELNFQSLEIVEKLYYLGHTIEGREDAVDSNSCNWSKF